MKKLLLLFICLAGLSRSSSAQVTFSFDSIWVVPYICQASHFDVEVFGTVADGSTQYGTQSYSVSNDTIYAKFHFVSGPGPALPYPLYRKINIPAPWTFGMYKVVAHGIYNGQVLQTITARIGICNSTLTVPENRAALKINVFPNPVSRQLLVTVPETSKMYQLEIVDVSGKTWFNSQNVKKATAQVNVAGLPAGIYFLKVRSEKGISVQKFVKQ